MKKLMSALALLIATNTFAKPPVYDCNFEITVLGQKEKQSISIPTVVGSGINYPFNTFKEENGIISFLGSKEMFGTYIKAKMVVNKDSMASHMYFYNEGKMVGNGIGHCTPY